MHPILFSCGSVTVYSYGFAVALGVLVALFFLARRGAREGFNKNDVTDCAIYSVFSGVVGGRIIYILKNWSEFVSNPIAIFELWKGGLVFYGGVGGALIFFILFCRAKKISFLRLADLFVPYLALAHVFGRIGCFLNGCCYGKPTRLPWGVSFPGQIDVLHPVQIYEAIFLVILFVVLSKLYSRRRFDGEIFLLYFMVYPASRFVFEFFRGDQCVFFFGLTLFQAVSILIIGLALTAYFFMMRSRKHKTGKI